MSSYSAIDLLERADCVAWSIDRTQDGTPASRWVVTLYLIWGDKASGITSASNKSLIDAVERAIIKLPGAVPGGGGDV